VPWLGFAVYGVPIGASLLAIWFIRNNKSMELPVATADWIASRFARFSDAMTALRLRLWGGGASGQGAA